MKYLFLFLFITFLFASCGSKDKKAQNSAFSPADTASYANDYERLLSSGESIIGTLSGPDTYYEYRGMELGLQYALISDFAQTEGLQLQVDLGKDTTDLIRKLDDGDIDIICVQLPLSVIKKHHLIACGATDKDKQTAWAVSADSKALAEALNKWYKPDHIKSIQQRAKTSYAKRDYVRRRVHAPYLSREKGIISNYDHLFKKASAITGWDWRLVAAQCYQESGFDPQAVSWAGARGLMQIMPSTAGQLGVAADNLYNPEENISTAARYIRFLSNHFNDVRDRAERINFILAAYNGGFAHIRDAMALTRKYGGNPTSWKDVGPYVLRLSQPQYYRDPVVKSGYMIGSETYNYVQSVTERWRRYGGSVAAGAGFDDMHSTPIRATKRNRFTHKNHIMTPDELENAIQ